MRAWPLDELRHMRRTSLGLAGFDLKIVIQELSLCRNYK